MNSTGKNIYELHNFLGIRTNNSQTSSATDS